MREALAETKHLLISSRSMTSAATASGNIDVSDAGYATIVINLASEINTNAVGPTLSLLESNDTTVTNFATIVANVTALDITTARLYTYGVDLRGRKKYLRLTVTTATATNDDVKVGAECILSAKTIGPVGTNAFDTTV